MAKYKDSLGVMTISDQERERLIRKEEKNHAGAILNNVYLQAVIGSHPGGCISSIITIIILVFVVILARACALT